MSKMNEQLEEIKEELKNIKDEIRNRGHGASSFWLFLIWLLLLTGTIWVKIK